MWSQLYTAFWHLKCDAGLTDIRLPALGGYIREVALLASVVAVCLQIRLLRLFIFCDFAHCSWLLYFLVKCLCYIGSRTDGGYSICAIRSLAYICTMCVWNLCMCSWSCIPWVSGGRYILTCAWCGFFLSSCY